MARKKTEKIEDEKGHIEKQVENFTMIVDIEFTDKFNGKEYKKGDEISITDKDRRNDIIARGLAHIKE